MRRQPLWALGLVLLLVSGCGLGKNQNPVGSDDELGRTRAESEESKPGSYVTREGDTLRAVAARPEIYSDADLWPLLMDANEASLGAISPGKRLAAGRVLTVPRSMDVDAMDMARERARQYAAAVKSARRVKHPERERVAKKPKLKPSPAVATPVAQPSPVPVAAQPVPKAKSGGMLPILFLLLLVLAALGGVLYVFSRRDKQDKA